MFGFFRNKARQEQNSPVVNDRTEPAEDTVDDQEKESTMVASPEENTTPEQDTTTEVDEWFEENHIPDDFHEVEDIDDEVTVPEEDKDGWYDPKVLADIDENTSPEKLEEIGRNTDNDLLENSQLPEENIIQEEDNWNEDKALSRWGTDGGALHHDPSETVETTDTDTTPVFVEETVTEQPTTETIDEPSLTIVNSAQEVTDALSGRPVYLVDLSGQRYGQKLIGMVPGHMESRSVAFSEESGYEILFDLPAIIEEQKDDEEKVAILIVGVDEVVDKAVDLLEEHSISRQVIVDRVSSVLDDARNAGISVVVAPTSSGNSTLLGIAQELNDR